VRNPLTVGLAAMALHTVLALAFRWPYPSVATFVAGMLAVVGAVAAPKVPSRAAGGMAALAFFAPSLVPVPLLSAGVAASLGPLLAPPGGPLRTVLVALPSIALLTLALTIP